MSPDSLETKFAELRAEVRAWEHQLRAQGPLVTQTEVLRSELARANRDIESLRTEVNQRIHEVHDEQSGGIRREVENLNSRISRISDRRETELKDLSKRIGDVSITLEQKIEVRARECRDYTNTEIAELSAGHATLATNRLTVRGQNLLAITALFAAIGSLVVGIITQIP